MLEQREQSLIGPCLAGAGIVFYGAFAGSSCLTTMHAGEISPLSNQTRLWESPVISGGSAETPVFRSDQEWVELIEQFTSKLLGELVEPDPEIERVVSEQFWELI